MSPPGGSTGMLTDHDIRLSPSHSFPIHQLSGPSRGHWKHVLEKRENQVTDSQVSCCYCSHNIFISDVLVSYPPPASLTPGKVCRRGEGLAHFTGLISPADRIPEKRQVQELNFYLVRIRKSSPNKIYLKAVLHSMNQIRTPLKRNV